MRKSLFLSAFMLLMASLQAQSVLWEVKQGKKTEGYILGSMHIPGTNFPQIMDKARGIVSKCPTVALEIDFSKMDPVQLVQMIREDTFSLKAYWKEEYPKFNQLFLERTSMELSMFDQHHPFFLISFLMRNMTGLGDPMDLELMQAALDNEQRIVGLETMESQLALMRRIPYSKQMELLEEVLVHYDRSQKLMEELTGYYRKGEVEQLRTNSAEMAIPEELKAQFMEQRDQHFAQGAGALFEQESSPVCIVVGAGHLGGEKGVLNLLRKKEYVLKPMK